MHTSTQQGFVLLLFKVNLTKSCCNLTKEWDFRLFLCTRYFDADILSLYIKLERINMLLSVFFIVNILQYCQFCLLLKQ